VARKKRKARIVTTDRARLFDEEIIVRLQKDAPEVLNAEMSEAVFDAAVEGLLKEFPLPKELPHFYCRKCGEYHLKTHPHYRPTQERVPPTTKEPR
jgi:hypothetical protein